VLAGLYLLIKWKDHESCRIHLPVLGVVIYHKLKQVGKNDNDQGHKMCSRIIGLIVNIQSANSKTRTALAVKIISVVMVIEIGTETAIFLAKPNCIGTVVLDSLLTLSVF